MSEQDVLADATLGSAQRHEAWQSVMAAVHAAMEADWYYRRGDTGKQPVKKAEAAVERAIEAFWEMDTHEQLARLTYWREKASVLPNPKRTPAEITEALRRKLEHPGEHAYPQLRAGTP